MPAPVLLTERLVLRGFRESDLDAFAAMQADPMVMRFLGVGAMAGLPRNRSETWTTMAAMVGQWELRGCGIWALEERGTGAFVGRAGILFPEGWPERELAYALAQPFWGRGLAQEACRAALAWAFATLDVPRLVSFVRPENQASRRVLQRLGAEQDGVADLPGVYAERWVHRRPDSACG